MQQVIEEILKTEEESAKRLEEERARVERRRAEIESENAERVRAFREREEEEASRKVRDRQEELRRGAAERIAEARQAAERDFLQNQALLDRIVERIVSLVTGSSK